MIKHVQFCAKNVSSFAAKLLRIAIELVKKDIRNI